jgi:hypothetical protein
MKLSDEQIKMIYSAIDLNEIKNYIEQNFYDYMLYRLDEHEGKISTKKGFFGSLSICEGEL